MILKTHGRRQRDVTADRALADTSLFIGQEQRGLDESRMPAALSVSIITIGELKLGVLAARSATDRAARLRTLSNAMELNPIPVDDAVATAWAELRVGLREAGHKAGVNDVWIAATAIAHGLPLVTQDGDFDAMPGLEVIKV
jgi:predicted nucleic acid-binding protein